MCSKLKVVSAIFLLSLTISTPTANAGPVEDIASAVLATTVQAKYTLFKSAWDALRSNVELDLNLAATLHKTMQTEMILNPKKLPYTLQTRRAVDGLYQDIRGVLITLHGRLVAGLLNINTKANLDTKSMQSYIKNFEYDPGTALKIFEKAIDEVFGSVPVATLAQYLTEISSGDAPSFELEVKTQLSLFNKYKFHGIIDNYYELVSGYLWQAYRTYSEYPLSDELRLSVDTVIIAKLPGPVRSAFFPSTQQPQCLNNPLFNEFLFESTNNIDVLTQKAIEDTGHWEMEPKAFLNSQGYLYFTVTIKNKKTKHSIFRVEADNKIQASSAADVPPTGNWNLSIRNNRFVLAQAEYLLCVTTAVTDDKRTTFAFKVPAATAPAACTWEYNVC